MLPAPEKILPHRAPMLLLDEVLELSDTHVVASRVFREDEEFFKGHFPGEPIVPGVYLVEAMAQATGLPLPVCRILVARGVAAEAGHAFLAPTLRELLPDPRSFPDGLPELLLHLRRQPEVVAARARERLENRLPRL